VAERARRARRGYPCRRGGLVRFAADGGIMTATKTVRRGWVQLAILGTFALTSVVGCGGVRRIPVSGAVTVDDQPLNGGYLVFTPDTAKGNTHRISCTSPIKDGRYNLETNGVSRPDSGPGVPLGWYKVTFRILVESTKKHPQAPINVNEKYKNVETTPLSVEVKDNPEPGAYDFKLTK
jgi:hypothetical protein